YRAYGTAAHPEACPQRLVLSLGHVPIPAHMRGHSRRTSPLPRSSTRTASQAPLGQWPRRFHRSSAPPPVPALRYIAAMPRPSQPLRYLVAIALAVGVAMLLLTLLRATDAALSVWQRLQDWPLPIRYGAATLFALLLMLAVYGVWRLLRQS